MGAVEDIILRHGQRGMDVLREYCPPEFCREAAECIFRARRGNVLLLTGFYIAGCGVGETDGPPGTLFLRGLHLRELCYNRHNERHITESENRSFS